MKIISGELIAPCGMDCAVCRAHLRPKNPCPGCNFITAPAPKTIITCFMRNCDQRDDRFCFSCSLYPCERLSHLDKRYRLKYGMSEIENLEYIRQNGLDAFVEFEHSRWQPADGTFCVHDRKRY